MYGRILSLSFCLKYSSCIYILRPGKILMPVLLSVESVDSTELGRKTNFVINKVYCGIENEQNQ